MQDNKVPPTGFPGKRGGDGDDFDMIVVGGGITGCGIARDAILRGLRVALVEMNDFASGTSSRSSRLIHGGVRYLEHGHLHLVFEASAERRRLLRLAPHLVHPLQFTWPVYRGARVPLWKLAAGLTLYDVLALFRNVGRHRVLSASAVRALQPSLRADGLVGGATYFDASTDDSRLTLAVAMDARDRGATMLNHTKADALIIENGHAVGIQARDVLTGTTTALRAPMVVNACGPWSDSFRALEGTAGRAKVQGSKGVHIAVPNDRVGNNGALTLLSPTDGRVMFILPGDHQTIIGTTDTFTAASPDAIRASEADIAYLLAAANAFFPVANLQRADVISAWAGIRPLAASETGDPVAASREHVISVTPAGIVTITGGKLTTFRVMAMQTVDRALRHARQPFTRTKTDVPIAKPELPTWHDGSRESERIHPEHSYRFGDLRYACEREQARTLGDLLIRRTRLAFERRDNARSLARPVADYVGPLLGWSAIDIATHLERYEREVETMFGIDLASS